MMNGFKILGTATALGLAMSAVAYANGNQAYIGQDGNHNSALISQDGNGSASGNQAGKSDRVIFQDNNESTGADKINRLTITQTGSGNKVGLETNGLALSRGAGLYQEKSYGVANGNGGFNTMAIDQATSNNVVGAVSQYTATHLGGNSLTIRQEGGNGNVVGKVMQYRTQTTSNEATVVQNGTGNVLEAVRQVARNAGSKNTITATFTGDANGAGLLTGAFASTAGAASSQINQGVDINTPTFNSSAVVTITGDDNQFGVTQVGALQKQKLTANLTVLGDDNQTAVYQSGELHFASLTVTGDYNDVGVRQVGSANVANVGLIGSQNNLGLTQDGTSNNATIDVFGSENNGGALSGVAAIAGLTTGLVSQTGDRNTATLTVGTLVADSDSNNFAVRQSGNDNTATATVGGGHSNQFGISQTGNASIAVVTQNGSFNVSGISQ